MASTLLKLNDSSGNLKEITTAEEQYIAYRVAHYLATTNNTSRPGIVKTGTGNKAVGPYTNTFFNQAVGTHPGSSISSGTTVTSVIQLDGSADTTASNGFRRPVSWDGTADGIKELTDAEMDTIADRVLSYLMSNEWAGPNYRLSSSTPSGYTAYQSNVFSDTRVDGTTVNYSLFAKTTMPAAPTVVRPMCLRYEGSTFAGMQEMTDDQIGYTFGQWIRARMVSANDTVGRYLLLPAGQTPNGNGYAGTWASRGTATDTKNVTSEVAYSADYSANYQRNSTNTFTGDFVGNYIGAVTYSATYSLNYTRNSVRTYSRYFVRSRRVLKRTFMGYYSRSYVRNFIGDYVGNYTGNYVNENIQYSANYTQVFTGDFVGDYIGNYVGNYVGTAISSGTTTVNTFTLYTRVS